MEDLVTITVDGAELRIPKGTLLWEACKAHGIDIPIFCYHTKLGPVGACRTCLVEQEGITKGPITACSTPVADGMVIRTKSAVVEKAQRGIFEFLLANHPLDCPICDRGGECPLQDQTFRWGPGVSRYIEPKRHHVKPIVLGPTIALDRERCVLCWRCVRFCADIAEDKSIVLLDRGDHTIVGTFGDRPYVSNFSGNVVELCPVGALTSRKQRFNFRAWELQNRPSVCPHCPMGCNINISVRKNDEIIRFLSRDNPEVDNSWLCDRGRFGFEFVNSPDRIHSPLIRRNEAFEQVSWSEALQFIAERLGQILEESGPEGVAGLASPQLTNENLFAFKRFITQTMGAAQVDHFPRPALQIMTEGQRIARQSLDQSLTSVAALRDAGAILLLGANPSRRAPVLELRIREAVNKHGVTLLSLQSEDMPLSSKAQVVAPYVSGQLALAVRALVGNPTDPGLQQLVASIPAGKPVVVVYDDTFVGTIDKADALEAVASLVSALAATHEVGVLPLLDCSNSMGARDLELFPVDSLPWSASLLDTLTAPRSPIRAVFILGADPTDDSRSALGAALSSLDLLVVHELRMTATAQLADVILPAASFAETTGTFTNMEGRVQLVTSAVPSPGIARPDWEILVDLSQYFERPLPYTSASEIWNDVRNSVTKYNGVGYEDIGPRGIRPSTLQLV